MFKTSVKGFKKSDVNNYIIQMHREFAEEKEAHDEELSLIRTEKQKAQDALSEKDALIDELNKKICEAESVICENKKLSAENERLSDEVAALTAELSCVSLRAEIAEGKIPEIKGKLDEATDTVAKLESALSERKPACEANVCFNVPDSSKTSSENKKGRNSILSKFKRVFN
ncbi:MAG: hypothetical protein IJO81_00415 [Clostridia bacterium]|nr:hypothetical protein [Clostridia bacterium]